MGASHSSTREFTTVDVFTSTPFEGNPLAVFPHAQGLSDDAMQRIARETNLSETTFVFPATTPQATYQVRIFTTASELPYAGHPSVGTAWLLAKMGRLALKPGSNRFTQEVKAGLLPIHIDADAQGAPVTVWTTQAKPSLDAPLADRKRVAAALGLGIEDLHADLPIQKVSTGLPWLLVPLRDADALDRVRPNLAEFSGPGSLYHNVYPFTLKPKDTRMMSEARGFPLREFEDPVTGSASGCLGAYLVAHGRLRPDQILRHAQGRHLHRPGQVMVKVTVSAERNPEEVQVGGNVVQVAEGRMAVPPQPSRTPALARPAVQ
ncbi:MAG TPA: PhzF family phenazine biosynthesis protein [Candidatus Thermoplasmatota archaeon]|nr:PhzF family phenazine biosynthesis protein [Candidatus Thermoplasmatota archaeon]